MKTIGFKEWLENCKDDLFYCPECGGHGRVDDICECCESVIGDIECILCDEQGKVKIKDMGEYSQRREFKLAVKSDVKKYCVATGKDYSTELAKINFKEIGD